MPLIYDHEGPIIYDASLIPGDIDVSTEDLVTLYRGEMTPLAWITTVKAEQVSFLLESESGTRTNIPVVNVGIWSRCYECQELNFNVFPLSVFLKKSDIRLETFSFECKNCTIRNVMEIYSALVKDPENLQYPGLLNKMIHKAKKRLGRFRSDLLLAEVETPETGAATRGTISLRQED